MNAAFSCGSALFSYKLGTKGENAFQGNRGDGDIETGMWKLLIAVAVLATVARTADAATAVNKDAQARTLVVTEGGDKNELTIAPGETVQFCGNGCFVTLPNGDVEALTGSETIEISGGAARIR